MSVNAVDWALRFAPVDARHNGAARVLMCLANVADDEGRNAHPTHRKLAAWCKCSVSTVKRHLSWLEANGLIRRGDQRQAGHFSEWHRPVVWDLCLKNRLELDPDFFDSNDIDSTRGGRPSTENRARGNPGSHVDRGYGDGDTGKPQLTGEPRFTAVTPPPAHLVSYSTSLVRNNPSAPTGHLPASGETSPDDDGIREDGSWADAAGAEPPSSESAGAGSDAEAVCRTMADGLRAMPPMPVPEPLARPGKRELDAARRLIARHGMPLVLAVAEREAAGWTDAQILDELAMLNANMFPCGMGAGNFKTYGQCNRWDWLQATQPPGSPFRRFIAQLPRAPNADDQKLLMKFNLFTPVAALPASGADPLAPLAAALGGVATRGDLPALYALACDTVPGARPGVAGACARGGGAAPLAQT